MARVCPPATKINADLAHYLAFPLKPAKIRTGSVEPFEWAKAHFFVGMRQAVVSKIEEIARRVTDSEGIELVQVELKGGGQNQFLRISIDKPEGITHADCENISQQVGTILDVEDVVPGRYTLEVSSPGVERQLVKEKDFERFQGKKVKVVLREAVDNQRHLEGRLAGAGEGLITLDLGSGRTARFRFDQVEKANLKFEW